ncbi:MAG: AAA family ATPase [Planctomycetaceae bacterium]|nr:AAA family ATPase [Planctomycetaceae bacterium]
MVEDPKLTPADFLAELQAQRTPGAAPAPSGPESIDELSFDFSDLDEVVPESPTEDDADSSLDVLARIDASLKTAEESAEAEGEPSGFEEQDADAQETGNDAPATDDQQPPDPQSEGDLTDLFARVHTLLDEGELDAGEPFQPTAPSTLEETGLTYEEVERLILKYVFSKGSATGRQVCQQIRMPYGIIEPIMKQLKQDQMLAFKGTAEMGDYDFAITEFGRERARAYMQECTYFGSAPVTLKDYLHAMAAQSIAKQEVSEEDLEQAFSDLIMDEEMLAVLGPAINSGRGMFLFGEAGNGKTSVAERVTKCFGSTIWIPRTLGVDGDIIRLFDPGVHDVVERSGSNDSIFDLSGVDPRWIEVGRPTVIAGGELTMKELEVTQNNQTKICEAPLQLKSNCGTLVIDDFGRQTMPIDELLNRWIVPLEKRYDFLNLPCGKKIQVPFDQLIIFSTNLEPSDLVDGAFMRRIPYKIEAKDPTREQFHGLFDLMCPMLGFTYDRQLVEYLIETHYTPVGRPFRACQPRDLLLQVRNYCTYKSIKKELKREYFDFAVANYFSVM